METLALGTIEYLVVDVTDKLEGLLALPVTTFEVRTKSGAVIQAATAATVDGMQARCLVNTTVGAWTRGEYHLYITFTTLPETPVLGPLKFLVN